jgi:hypothetical protein
MDRTHKEIQMSTKSLQHKTTQVEFATPSRQPKRRSDAQSVKQFGRKCIHFPVKQVFINPSKDTHVTLQEGTLCTWIFSN